jgi:hypothetical protein
MRHPILASLALASALCGTAAVEPRVSRATLAAMEKSFDHRIQSIDPTDPFDLLGSTRGIYLEGYGAVFTAEVNLVVGPGISPFRPRLTKEQIAKLRQKKLARLPVLKRQMKDALGALAASLDTVPPSEQIVLGVTLDYYSWEERAGLPGQVVMQARRQALLDVTSGRIRDAGIREQEF